VPPAAREIVKKFYEVLLGKKDPIACKTIYIMYLQNIAISYWVSSQNFKNKKIVPYIGECGRMSLGVYVLRKAHFLA
jgi:hypothetical protein